MSNKSGQ